MKTAASLPAIARPVEPAVFYVYILFDWQGVPRYVGKGKGGRWLEHERYPDPNNWLKNIFVARTRAARGEIPKVKIAEHLTEPQAFEIETAFIKAIGRYPDGPLTNLTDTRSGPSSKRMIDWHASRTAEERSATIRKGLETMGPEKLRQRSRNNALAQGREQLTARMANWQAKRTAAERSANARQGGLASMAARTPEQRKDLSGFAQMTPEQRHKYGKRAYAAGFGIAQLTSEQLSEYGRKGIATANANRTSEQRRALARTAGLASAAARIPEQRKELARRGGLKGGAATKAKWAAIPKPPPKYCIKGCGTVLKPRNSSGLCRSCAASLRNIKRYRKPDGIASATMAAGPTRPSGTKAK